MRFTRRAAALVGVAALLAASGCGGGGDDGGTGPADVEVFTWWADGGEKAGLDGLVGSFGAACAGQRFVNGAVAGGAGAAAKEVLASRLRQGDPPDTFQAHAGAELSTYIGAGQIEDLSAEYDAWGLRRTFPAGLIENLTVDGRIYSVPTGIHRANVVWSNTELLARAGVTGTPRTLDDFFAALDKVRQAGVAAPLALGKDWTQLMLFEAVLITNLGAERFTGLWKGATSFDDPAVVRSIGDYRRLLTYTNTDRDALDWTNAEQLVVDGRAAFQLMGDWAASDLDARGLKGYGWFTFPGNGDTFQWLADSFVLPTGARNAGGTRCRLKAVGSAEGQRAFNLRKGSIPARTDAAATGYPRYQAAAMADWKAQTQVPSCAHGSACPQGWQEALNSAFGAYSTTGDDAALHKALSAAAAQFAVE